MDDMHANKLIGLEKSMLLRSIIFKLGCKTVHILTNSRLLPKIKSIINEFALKLLFLV